MKINRGLCFFVLLGGFLLPWAGCGRGESVVDSGGGPEPIRVAFGPLGRATLRVELDLVGTLIPLRATTVVADVDGRILSFPASERLLEYEEAGQWKSQALGLDLGHRVRAGEVLVRIDPVDFELAVNAAMAELELARRNLEHLVSWHRTEEVQRLAALLEEAEASRDRARSDLGRAQQLIANRAISQGEFDQAASMARIAEASVKQAEAAVAVARAGPTAEELAVAEARVATAAAELALQQERLAKTTVHAPYDAVISERYVDVGDRVTAMPRVEIMQIIDPQVLFAQVAVPERYQSMVRLDVAAVLTADGVAAPLAGRVDLINAKIDPETRTFRVRIAVDNRQGLLKAGGFVRVALPIRSAEDVPVVPIEAVVFTDGRPAVYVQQAGRVRRVPVELGLSDGRFYQITAGVLPGQEVAVNRTSLLTDGMPVQVVPAGDVWPAAPEAATPADLSAGHNPRAEGFLLQSADAGDA